MAANKVICVAAIMIGSYYTLLTLKEYFAYETVTKTTISRIYMTETVYLVCAPKDHYITSSIDQSKYLWLESFSSNKLVCLKVKAASQVDVSHKILSGMTIYAPDSHEISPWNLNHFNQIYDTVIDESLRFKSNSCFVISVMFRRFEARLLSLPYHTDCFEYEQHECMYHCLKKQPEDEQPCFTRCSKASCKLRHAELLSSTTYFDKTALTNQVVITEAENVIRTEFSPKSSLGLAAVNVFGLFGVFIGLSALDLVHCARRLVFQPSRLVKRSAVSLLYLAGVIHAISVVYEYLQYGYGTEVYQGKNVQQPKRAYAICIPGRYDSAYYGSQVPFDKLVLSIYLSTKQGDRLTLYEDSERDTGARIYATKYVTAFTIERQLCYRSTLPDDVPAGMRSTVSSASFYSEVDYMAYVSTILLNFYVTALVHENDLILSNPYYEKVSGENAYRLLYSEVQSLSYPFKTACENYGRGLWESVMSRQHCAEQCALKKFQSANPGRSPEDLSMLRSWNWSAIDGKVKPFIDECLAQHCRRVDCTFKQFSLSMINARASTSLYINVIKPNESAFLFKHVPLTSMVDTILLVISVFGIWTGFSLMNVKTFVQRSLRKSHTSKRNRTRVSFVVKLVITTLFALNIYTVVNEYVKYDFTTQSVCRKASMTKDFVMLMKYDGPPIKHKAGQGSSLYLANMVKHAWFRHPKTLAWSPYTRDYLANITWVYKWTFSVYLAVELNSSLDKLDLDVTGSMPVFRLDMNDYQASEVFITSSRDDMSQGDFFSCMTNLEHRVDVVATFESLVVKSLPAPFVFACVDYTNYGYRNQRDCINSCIRQQGIKRYNSIDHDLVLVNMDVDNYRASDHSHAEEVRSYCTNACSRPSCLKKIYSTKQSSFRRRQQGRRSIFVDSNVQETQITYLAKVAINEFIMYLGNTFSTWFGFCFFDLTSLVTYMRKRLKETPLVTS